MIAIGLAKRALQLHFVEPDGTVQNNTRIYCGSRRQPRRLTRYECRLARTSGLPIIVQTVHDIEDRLHDALGRAVGADKLENWTLLPLNRTVNVQASALEWAFPLRNLTPRWTRF